MTPIQNLRLASLGLACLLAIALAVMGTPRSDGPRAEIRVLRVPSSFSAFSERENAGRERAKVESKLGEAEDFAGFAKKYAASYPAEWSGLIDNIAGRNAAGADDADASFAEALRQLRRARGVVAAKAAPAALSRIFETQAATLAALSVLDKRQCVDFLLGQQNKAFQEFSTRHRPLIAKMADAAIDAILDGAASNISRSAPTKADFELLETELRGRGLGTPEIEALLDGRYPDPPLPDAQLCEAGIQYLDVLKSLPEDTRLRLYAFSIELMAKM